MTTYSSKAALVSSARLISALRARGFTPADAKRIAAGEAPSASSPAAAPVTAKPSNGFYLNVIRARVGCAYGIKSCGAFAPNGVGSRQHTTCPKGRAALKAARK